jgi:hypothetical protein
MRKSSWTPSIVPRGDDHDVYLVVDDLGRIDRALASRQSGRLRPVRLKD